MKRFIPSLLLLLIVFTICILAASCHPSMYTKGYQTYYKPEKSNGCKQSRDAYFTRPTARKTY